MISLDFPVERIQLGFEGSAFRGVASLVDEVELGLKRANFLAQGADVAAHHFIDGGEFSRGVRVAAKSAASRGGNLVPMAQPVPSVKASAQAATPRRRQDCRFNRDFSRSSGPGPVGPTFVAGGLGRTMSSFIMWNSRGDLPRPRAKAMNPECLQKALTMLAPVS